MFTCVMHVLQVYSLCVCVCVYASVRVCAHSNTDRRKSSRRKIRCSAVSLQLQPPSPNQPSLYATPSQAVSFGGKTAGTLHGGDCAHWPRVVLSLAQPRATCVECRLVQWQHASSVHNA
mmetsp:Transcript_85600/g.138793  ORF Transcript_85600/g.138793 Transcript_85600/m.138793 type:complete len:119 (-) Transcript_85600:78-434(-)